MQAPSDSVKMILLKPWPPEYQNLGPKEGFNVQHKNIIEKFLKNDYSATILPITLQAYVDSVDCKVYKMWFLTILGPQRGLKFNIEIYRKTV